MENSGLISVIIPVYNVEKYLRECVDGVLGQTYRNFEIILVDDGSTDSSSAICDEYAEMDERIRVFHKENGGASSARNFGLKKAVGEFVYFLDSDDRIVSSALEKLHLAIEKNCADFAFCEAYAIDEVSGKTSLKNYSYHKDYGVGDPKEFFSEMLNKKEFHVVIWSSLYRTSFIKKESLSFHEGIMYEDCIFSFVVYTSANIAAHVHEPLYYRRYRSFSVMTSIKTIRNYVSAHTALTEIISIWDRQGSPDYVKKYIVRIAYNAINNYYSLSRKEKKEALASFAKLKKTIIRYNGFDDESLIAAAHSKQRWIIYKAKERFQKKLRRS